LGHPASPKPDYFPTKTIEFDVETGEQKLIPFTKRKDRAPKILLDNYDHYVLEPPTMKEEDDITYDEIFTQRWAGEPLDRVQRDHVTKKIRKIQEKEKDRIDNNIEWMLSQLVTTGQINYSGEYSTFSFDFEVPANFSGATANWSDATHNILLDLRTWKKMIFKATNAKSLIALATPNVATNILSNTSIKDHLDNRRIVIGEIDYGFPFIGRLSGVPIYEFDEDVTNESGVKIDLHGATNLFILIDPSKIRMHYAASFNKTGPIMTKYYSYQEEVQNPQGLRIYAETHGAPILEHNQSILIATITV
jgi:hypothetical protein